MSESTPSRIFLAELAALRPPRDLVLDEAVFRTTVRELVAQLDRAWGDALDRSAGDRTLRADLVGILERIALVHARYVDAALEPRAPRARAAVYAAATLILAEPAN